MTSRSSLLLLLALAACGNDPGANLPDGSEPSTDAAPASPDADPSAVVVTVHDDRSFALIAGAHVVFNDSSGAIVDQATTDQDGRAIGSLPAGGGSVTAIASQDGEDHVTTVFAARPGDELVIGGDGAAQDGEGYAEIHLPADPLAHGYQVFGPCPISATDDATHWTLEMSSDCRVDTMNLVAVSLDADGHPLDFLDDLGVPFVPSMNLTMSGAWRPVGAFTASLTDLPASDGVDVDRLDGADLGVSPQVHGLANATALDASFVRTGAPTAVIRVSLRHGAGHEEIYQTIDGSAPSLQLDVAAHLGPWLVGTSFDETHGTLQVSSSGDGGYDGFLVESVHHRFDGSRERWDVYVPAGGSYQLPAIPADLGPITPQPNWLVESAHTTAVKASDGSWDQVRAQLAHAFSPSWRLNQSPADLRIARTY